MSDNPELTLLVLRLGFLAVLWLFIFAIVYALRSDLFGQRVRKLAQSNPNQFQEPGQGAGAGAGAGAGQNLPQGAASPFMATQPGPPSATPAPATPRAFDQPGSAASAAAGAAMATAGAAAGARQPPPISSLSAPGTPSGPGVMATVHNAGRLVITSGPKSGTAIQLGREPLTIGRSTDSGLVIRDDFTSTHHARLLLWNDDWMLQDLDSTNGTFLGSQRVTVPTPVPLDATVKIGTTTFELRR